MQWLAGIKVPPSNAYLSPRSDEQVLIYVSRDPHQ
jgi:hypothetical protein